MQRGRTSVRKKFRSDGLRIFILLCLIIILFCAVYYYAEIAKLKPEPPVSPVGLNTWEEKDSAANGLALKENKDIYKNGIDADIYDVYISVYPTKDENGEVLTLADFALHSARNHDYNPTLKCNVQILPEGGRPERIISSDTANASIRVRGNSARGHEYKSYKIKFLEEKNSFKGQSSLNINKHTSDDVKIVTKLMTDLLRDIPDVVSFDTNFMRLWIRDASLPVGEQEFIYQGLYTNTEQPNKTFLRRRGLPSECNMYKARNFSFRPSENLLDTDDPMYDEGLFEQILGIREGREHTELLEMLAAVNDPSRDFSEVFETYFNEDNYLSWLAFSILTGSEDILNHNYIIYSPVNCKTWYFIPWDFDKNLQTHDSYHMTPSLAGGQKLNMVPLHRGYFRSENALKKLDQKMQELMDEYLTERKIRSLTDAYIPVLEKTMREMPDVTLTKYAPDELVTAVNNLPQLIKINYENFRRAFAYPAPMFVNEPAIKADGSLSFSWEESYSYQNLPISYELYVYSDYSKQNLLFSADEIEENHLDTQLILEPGTYYLDVHALDSDGHDQISLEHFEFSGASFVYVDGLREFTVPESGKAP